ncbi:Gfo/Idh/MocA family oxidoreductase [Thermostilla marina]
MTRYSRRRFLGTAAGGLAAGVAVPLFAHSAHGSIFGANETINVGVAGINGRGQAHMAAFAQMENVRVTYLIDPDSRLFPSRAKKIEELGGNTPTCVQDIRKALEDDDLDAVSVATCNHWHSLITIWACQAGKDVYVEKPCSHNPFEGRKCVEAARKYGRIVAHGTQSRSSRSWAVMTAAARSGKYGKLLVSKGYASKPRWSIGYKEVKDPPPELDYDIWLGPAPELPYHENLVHYNWHWFWPTGNGEIGNQGVHQMDIARWAIGKTLPDWVVSAGGRYVDEPDHNWKDQGETPNMQITMMGFGDVILLFEVCGLVGKSWNGNRKFDAKVTNEFYTTEGVIRGGKFFPHGSDEGESLDVEVEMGPESDHFRNFMAAVRSRNPKDLNAEIETAHYSAALCHLGNISYRTGGEASFAEAAEAFAENDLAAASWKYLEENLAGALGVDLNKLTCTLGKRLRFNPAEERFIDAPEADKLLTRDYREPYVVPQEV